MEIQTFEAHSMREALKAVKSSLGNDAVILSTRETTKKGAGKIVEITASGPVTKGVRRQSAVRVESDPERFELDALKITLNNLQENAVTKSQFMRLEAGMRELKLYMQEALRARSGSLFEGMPENLMNLHKNLEISGVAPQNLSALFAHLGSFPEPDKKALSGKDKSEWYREHAIRWMLKKIQIAPKWDVIPGTTGFQVVVGANGVGKTSMIAKLAANYHKKHKVIIVSYGDQRIAANEQMRIFTKVLGIDFEIARDASEFNAVISKNKDAELVLIDTGGRSPKAEIVDLMQLKELSIPMDFHLCVSSTDKYEQVERAIQSFSPLSISSLIFTKLDECCSYGDIFNASSKWSVPLSFFSIGSEVPNDIERATRERVIERIFGL